MLVVTHTGLPIKAADARDKFMQPTNLAAAAQAASAGHCQAKLPKTPMDHCLAYSWAGVRPLAVAPEAARPHPGAQVAASQLGQAVQAQLDQQLAADARLEARAP